MSEAGVIGERKIKAFLDVPPRDRNNSKSLRRLLFDVIDNDFAKSVGAAAARFRTLMKGSKDPRKFRTHGRGISADSIYKVTRDSQPITFSQLDAIAQHVGLPLGIVLLFTRVRSEVEVAAEYNPAEALRILAASKAAMTALERILLSSGSSDPYSTLSHATFEEVRSTYSAVFEDLRSTLF